jgi:hypothetical protein
MVALVIASFGTLAKGQTISGTIVGTVREQQGGVLPGVSVTATNDETGLPYTRGTDRRGIFVIPEVPPGNYHVRAKFSGFQPQEHVSVRVDVNRVTEEDFTLRIFVSTKPTVVQSAAPMTDVSTATQGQNFNQKQIRELPLLSRDINNLALLAPGAESVRTFSFASTLVPFSVNGSWGRYNNFIIDSVSNNEPIFGGAATQFSNPDIFSDYAISTSVPKAEFGRNSGATVNVITKSGSSNFHGSGFWFGQDNRFNAMTRADTAALLTSTPPSYEQKVGGTLGGPLDKQKRTFFFLSYQYDRARADLSNVFPTIATVPTPAGLSALQHLPAQSAGLSTMFYYPSVSSIPALGGQCFNASTSTITGKAIPPVNPCYTGSASGYQFGTYDVPQGNLFDVYDHQASGRIDSRLSDSHDLYVRYLVDDLNTPQAILNPTGDVAFGDLGLLPDSRSILRQRTQSALLGERYQSSHSLNEVRFSYSRIAQGIGPYNLPASLRANPSATVADNFGGFGLYGANFPSAGSQLTLGQDTSTNVTHSNIYELQENFSMTRNQHIIKMGAGYVRTQSNIIDVPSDLGHYFYGRPGLTGGFSNFVTPASAYTTNAIAVLQALPDVYTNSAGVITGQSRNELGLREADESVFIQDDYHVRSDLTVSAGLRYEHFGQPINGMVRLNPAAGSLIPASRRDFGPRAGIAWSPKHNTVIRAGYSLMYNQMPLNIPLLIWQSAPVSPLVATITPYGAATYFNQTPTNTPKLAIPTPGNYPQSPLSLSAASTLVSGCSGAFISPYAARTTTGSVPLNMCSTQNTVAPNLDIPYVQSLSIGVQRELPHNIMVEVNYVSTKGNKLYQRADLNPYGGWNTACLASNGASVSCLNPRGKLSRGDITAVTNGGLSSYNGLQASLNTRAVQVKGNSLMFTAAYTWSHMIDTGSEIFGPGVRVIPGDILSAITQSAAGISTIEAATPFPQIPNNAGAERGNSSYDRRQRFVFSEIWVLPTPRNYTPAAKAILGGWNVNGVGTVQSGQPFSPLNGIPTGTCADAGGDGQLTNDRANIGNPSVPLNRVALLADPTCRSTSKGYVDLNGNAILPSTAHFVQVPLGTYGNAGRNIMTGPGIIDFDFALFKQVHIRESKTLEFRWEVYNVFNHPNPGYLLGNVFSSNAQSTPGYAFSPHASAAGVTGAIPENALDATTTGGAYDFLSQANMNTGTRTMQFGVHFTF